MRGESGHRPRHDNVSLYKRILWFSEIEIEIIEVETGVAKHKWDLHVRDQGRSY